MRVGLVYKTSICSFASYMRRVKKRIVIVRDRRGGRRCFLSLKMMRRSLQAEARRLRMEMLWSVGPIWVRKMETGMKLPKVHEGISLVSTRRYQDLQDSLNLRRDLCGHNHEFYWRARESNILHIRGAVTKKGRADVVLMWYDKEFLTFP